MAKTQKKQEIKQDMTLEEAKAFRSSLAKENKKELGEKERREAFKLYWSQIKKNYSKYEGLEDILWIHLKAVKMDEPEKFQQGLENFGIEKVK